MKKQTYLGELLTAYQKRDPAARSKVEIFLLYSGVHAVLYHCFANWCFRHKLKFLARVISQWSRFFTGIEIHPGATIGRRLVIDHGAGIVIGETTEIGNDVLIYQGVTLGGTGKEQGKRHPTIGNNVLIGSGARVLGPFTVGDNARIAANAVVLKEIPDCATAVGVPARVVRVDGQVVSHNYADEIDQVNVIDPVRQALDELRAKVEDLEQQLQQEKQNNLTLNNSKERSA
ncbi:serine O-acetyltransferase [Bengtsoniella intestinalis]|uniref:serine O-acetyltransferase n=1 Tax=Bengtsoniella intestinalis TaxID=3073143 RepID=UPI00391F7823